MKTPTMNQTQLNDIAKGITTINHNTTEIKNQMKRIADTFDKMCHYVFKIIIALLIIVGGKELITFFV